MKNNKYQKIRKSAFEVFSHKGYRETKIADIAQKSGVSPATIYKYFKNKKAIFESIDHPELKALRPNYREKQKEILKAALTVFGRKGFFGTSMEDIASICGISKAALYQYYNSKEEIFCAAVQQDTMLSGLDNLLLINTDQCPAEVLKKLADDYLKAIDEQDRINLLRAIISDSRRFTEPGELLYNKVISKFYVKLAAYFDKLKADGELRDINAKFAARSFIGILMSFLIIDRLVNPSSKEFSNSEIAENTVDIFLNGMRNVQ